VRQALAALLVAGCVAAPEGGGGATAPRAAGLHLDAQGIQPVGSPLRIDFGRAGEGVVAAVTRLYGTGPVDTLRTPGCGAGPVTEVRWANGLALSLVGGSFVGWVSEPGRGAPAGTAGGLAPGVPRATVEALPVVRVEPQGGFQAGGISGTFDGGAVAMLRAGRVCPR
jgi:hypothetical protein